MKKNFKTGLQVVAVSLLASLIATFSSYASVDYSYMPEEIEKYSDVYVLDENEYVMKEKEYGLDAYSTYGFHLTDRTSRIYVANFYGESIKDSTIVHECAHRMFEQCWMELFEVSNPGEKSRMQRILEKKSKDWDFLFDNNYMGGASYDMSQYHTEIFARVYEEYYSYWIRHDRDKLIEQGFLDMEIVQIYDEIEQAFIEKTKN